MAWAALDLPRFLSDAITYRSESGQSDRFRLSWRRIQPCLGDHRESSGRLDRHYFYQDLWAARKIHEARPDHHIDIGSRIDGFVSHLLCFMPVTVVDIRPLGKCVAGLNFIRDDATTLKQFPDSSVESLSSLHAVEHFGLGRYGDAIKWGACFDVMRSFERVLRRGGRLYLSVPIGTERLEFNSHRVFAPSTVMQTLVNLRLMSFSAIDDDGNLHENVDPADFGGMWYGCGLFEFTK